ELIFRDCFVPEDHVLGRVGGGFDVLVEFFPASNAYAAASVLGVAEAAYERALEWTGTRVQGGRPLLDHDLVAADVAEMRMLLDAARAYTYQAAWAADHRDDGWEPTLGAFPKVFASQVAWRVVTTALELHGGYGYMRERGLEKLVRDAAAFFQSHGANRSLLLKGAGFIRQTARRGQPLRGLHTCSPSLGRGGRLRTEGDDFRAGVGPDMEALRAVHPVLQQQPQRLIVAHKL